jgi:hypothetical protein
MPSGLLRIAFFDGRDPDRPGRFNGTAFKEMTDDVYFDLQIDISMYEDLGYESAESYILKTLEYMQYANVDITEIYLFDHGAADDGMELGDTFYSLAGPSDQNPQDQSLQKFAEKAGSFLKHDDPSTPDYDGAVINLRCCFGGTFADEVATWSGVRTTGWTQEITGHAGMNTGTNMETFDFIGLGPDKPDYGGNGSYMTYTPRADGGKADETGKEPPCSYGGYCGY